MTHTHTSILHTTNSTNSLTGDYFTNTGFMQTATNPTWTELTVPNSGTAIEWGTSTPPVQEQLCVACNHLFKTVLHIVAPGQWEISEGISLCYECVARATESIPLMELMAGLLSQITLGKEDEGEIAAARKILYEDLNLRDLILKK
jgi:hypothetical protein